MIHPIHSLEEFLAHAIAIEREATDRYREFELHYSRRGEDILAGLCGNLAKMEGEHLEELRFRSHGLDLPAIADHEYRWLDGASPEAPARTLFYTAASRRELLTIALRAEKAAEMFFSWAARTSHSAAVRELARDMAREEAQHVGWIEKALDYGSSSHIPA